MNIGFVAPFANPNDPNVSTAGYRRVTELIKLLSGDNKITLYIPMRGKWDINIPFCDVVFIRSAHIITLWLKVLRTLIKDRKKLDVLIAYDPLIGTSPIILMRVLYSIPIIVDYLDKHVADFGSQKKIVHIINLIIERLFLLTINNWFTDSKYLENEIRRFKKDANILLYRGTISEPSCLDEKAQSFLSIVNEKNINIAYLGGLYHYHGVDVLLNAFTKLTFENIHLYITGYGPMKPMLKEMVKKKRISNVRFIHLDNDMICNFLSKMDILVIPHRNTEIYTTGFPSKIIEYMWAGKAIIVTTVGKDVLDIFENGKTAILIEPENEAALRNALANLITDDKKRKELGINARRYFEDNFSDKVVKSKITEYFNYIINHKKVKRF